MNMIVAGAELQTANMDHHGLVAAVCQELGIAKRIDEKLWNGDERRVISPGKAVVAMILNGLGFTNRRLYLTHQFYEDKPLDRLLDADIKAKDITDYTLGHTLDEIASYGATQLFGELSFNIALEHDLLGMKTTWIPLGVSSHYVVVRIFIELIWSFFPKLDNEFVRCKPLQCF